MNVRLKNSLQRGFNSGLRTWWWLAKMMVLTTFVVAMLQEAGVIELLSRWLSPAFALFGLGGEAVVVFVTNALSNLYSGIAVIATLDLDYRSATILAVMGLICHNLVVETIIQRKAGASVVCMVLLRVGMALVAAIALNFVLPTDYSGKLIIERAAGGDGSLLGAIRDWGLNMLWLLPMMFSLIIVLNVLQQLLREFRLIDYLAIPVAPLLSVMGLARSSSFLWIVLNSLGLAYGGAVMIAELDEGQISVRDAKLLNTHVAVTHSLLEDTLIFVAIGLSAFWLIVPRLLLSIASVWTQRIYYHYKKR